MSRDGWARTLVAFALLLMALVTNENPLVSWLQPFVPLLALSAGMIIRGGRGAS